MGQRASFQGFSIFFFVYCVVFLMCLRASVSVDDTPDRKIPTVSEDRYIAQSDRNASTCYNSGLQLMYSFVYGAVILMWLHASVIITFVIGRVRLSLKIDV